MTRQARRNEEQIPLFPPQARSAEERQARSQALRTWLTGLPEKVADWPADLRDRWEERAGIMQFDGGLSREEAERRAEQDLRAEDAAFPATREGAP